MSSTSTKRLVLPAAIIGRHRGEQLVELERSVVPCAVSRRPKDERQLDMISRYRERRLRDGRKVDGKWAERGRGRRGWRRRKAKLVGKAQRRAARSGIFQEGGVAVFLPKPRRAFSNVTAQPDAAETNDTIALGILISRRFLHDAECHSHRSAMAGTETKERKRERQREETDEWIRRKQMMM